MGKKKRKNKAPHAKRPGPSERRAVISYDDIEHAPAPPVPRQKVSYASDSDSDHVQDEQTPDQRHELVSQQALRERERPQTDVTYGQIGAFPGLDPRDKEPFYGPANDGLDYLRMVRSEARAIPHIVTAPSHEPPQAEMEADYEDGDWDDEYGQDDYYDEDEDGHGWYEDGAYVARSTAALSPDPVNPALDAQEAYYRSLKTRFDNLRQSLRIPPSVQALSALDQDHPISCPAGNKAAEKEWKGHLHQTIPLPAQLASIDSQSILRLLKLLEGQLENCRSTNIPHNLSVWVWALLARLDHVGLLQTRDVSVVRDLAKMAVWVRMMHHRAKYGRPTDGEYHDYPEEDPGDEPDEATDQQENTANAPTGPVSRDVAHDAAELKEEGAAIEEGCSETIQAEQRQAQPEANQQEDVQRPTEISADQAGPGAVEAMGEDVPMDLGSTDGLSDIIAAKKRQLRAEAEAGTQKEDFPDVNTCVTIDMLVTVAAEFYGQKDLLVGRIPWDFSSD